MDQIKFMGLDEEWVELIMKARNLGLSVEDIREFFRVTSGKAETLEPVTDEGG